MSRLLTRRFGAGLRAAAVAALSLAASGCIYGFAGGGLPPHIRTVAVLPFDNQTADPLLTQEVTEAVSEAMQSNLGLRPAGESTADAVVRGVITAYEPDLTLSYQPAEGDRPVQVTRRRVRLTVNVEIVDQRQGRVLWQRSGLAVDGEYEPGNERAGRAEALRKLVKDIVDGAQSQW